MRGVQAFKGHNLGLLGISSVSRSSPAGAQGRGGEGRGREGRGGEGSIVLSSGVDVSLPFSSVACSCSWQRLRGIPCASLFSSGGSGEGRKGGEGRGGEGRGGEGSIVLSSGVDVSLPFSSVACFCSGSDCLASRVRVSLLQRGLRGGEKGRGAEGRGGEGRGGEGRGGEGRGGEGRGGEGRGV